MSTASQEPLLAVRDLHKRFPVSGGLLRSAREGVRALNGVSFDLCRGETLAVVGESGCGKSTLARCVLRLMEPSGGSIRFEGVDLLGLPARRLRAMRPRMQIVFQDPFASLNPRLSVGAMLAEPLRVHGIAGGQALERRVDEVLERVGLSSAHRHRYPHEFSGGQRQRIGIARALVLDPSLIVCDEAVSALDVSIRAQVLNLLRELQGDLGLAYVFISHDLNVVHHVADRVAVMYLGEIVETGTVEDVFDRTRHPYTAALLAANPVPDPEARRRFEPLAGEVPSPLDPPAGCPFHPRCPHAFDRCRIEHPHPVEFDGRGGRHGVRCLLGGGAGLAGGRAG